MSMIQDITFFSGDAAPVDVTLIDINLTGASVQFSMYANVDSTTVLLYKDTNNGISVTDATAGKFTFTLSAAETTPLKGTYYYEIKVIDVLENPTTVTTGSITAEVGRVVLSYATVDYADLYFDNVLFPEPWTTSDKETKEKALRMATKNIDALVLIGRRVTPDQMQEFPRSIYNAGRGVWVDETTISQCVKDATCEEALTLMRGGQNAGQRADLQRQGVKSFTLGKLSETYRDNVVAPTGLQSATARTLLQRYTGGSRAIG